MPKRIVTCRRGSQVWVLLENFADLYESGSSHADEARKYGCRSGMPGYIGKRLCPHLTFVQPDFSKYVRCAAA